MGLTCVGTVMASLQGCSIWPQLVGWADSAGRLLRKSSRWGRTVDRVWPSAVKLTRAPRRCSKVSLMRCRSAFTPSQSESILLACTTQSHQSAQAASCKYQWNTACAVLHMLLIKLVNRHDCGWVGWGGLGWGKSCCAVCGSCHKYVHVSIETVYPWQPSFPPGCRQHNTLHNVVGNTYRHRRCTVSFLGCFL